MAVTGKKPHSRDLVSAVLLLKLSASEKLVLQSLCWHYPNPYPSVARIAAMASQTERWVRQCLRSLQKKGLIEVHYRRDGQAQDTNFYMVKPDRILMQAGKRGKTTLRGGGSEFRGGGNSVPGEGEEVSTPKQSALDKAKKQDKKQNKKQQEAIENKASKPTCQQEEEDYELPNEEFGKESSTELSWEDVREMEELHNNDTDSNINPCLQSSSSIHTRENLSTESPMIPKEYSYVPRTESPSTKPAYKADGTSDEVECAFPEEGINSAGAKENISIEDLIEDNEELTIPNPSPSSEALPSPSLPAAGSENVARRALTPEEAFEKALKMAPHPGEKDLDQARDMWCSHCRDYSANEALQAFEYFLKAYPNLAASFGRPITNFWLTGRDGSLIIEMQRGKPGTVASGDAKGKSVGSDKSAQVEEPKSLKSPFDVDSKDWRHMGTERNWYKLSEFYHYPVHTALNNFFKKSGLSDKEVARQAFVMKPELWPTAEDMRAEEVRLAELKALEASLRGTSK